MAEFIAYYRVSTDRQGASGLGLAAQREAVARFLGSGQLVAEYTEIESGKRHANRPQLLAALADCRKRRAVLLIAWLDRLARNVAFIANLMESGVDFVAVDMPQATRLTIHISNRVIILWICTILGEGKREWAYPPIHTLQRPHVSCSFLDGLLAFTGLPRSPCW
jgi:DNA invertase Pin-like site-specific DNA recombinase